MNFIDLFLLAVALSMDAFAVAVCKSLAMRKIEPKHYVTVALWFGGFQALMPLIGYLLGQAFESVIETYSSYIAFILLTIIGVNMIREAFSTEEKEESPDMGFKAMFPLALATSIDALATGVALSCQEVNITVSVLFIGCVTAFLSALGLKIGSVFGTKYKNKAELAGGIILVLLGLKTLLVHFGVLSV